MRTSVRNFILGSVVTAVLYNNCSAVHERDASLSSMEACSVMLKDEFVRGYHPFLKNHCASCHAHGGFGNGAFADSDINLAFDSFNVRGNNLVSRRALDPQHQPPFTGAQHSDVLADLEGPWNSMRVQVDQCISAAGGTIDDNYGDGIVPEDPIPTEGTVTTFIKLLEASASSRTLTWNLGTEIAQPAGLSLEGAEFSIDVVSHTTSSGDKTYIFSSPRLRAGDDSLHMMYIGFIINNRLVSDATSFHVVNRRVPAGATRDAGVGSIAIPFDIRSTDTVSITFGKLDPIDFNPPTFAELISPTGVFGQNCLSCHDGESGNPDGNFDISSRDAVLRRLMVAPYSPNNSEIFKRMNEATSPMPPTGLLPDPQITQVLQWIQDGAR
jgi:hypothetical protein